LLEDGIQDGIRNLVGYLVGVAFRNRFRSKKKVVRHVSTLHKLLGALPAECFGERFSRLV
jgi:hypothetical protein